MHPWDRQPEESDRSFSAFQLYRDLPPSLRTVKRAAEADPAQRSERTFRQFSDLYHWVTRCTAYDIWCDDRRQERMESARAETDADMIELGKDMMRLAAQETALYLNGAELPPHVIPRLADIGAKLVRLVVGEPTSISESRSRKAETFEQAIARLAEADPKPELVDYSPTPKEEAIDG